MLKLVHTLGEEGRKASETCKTRHLLKFAGQDPYIIYIIMKNMGARIVLINPISNS